MDYETVSRMAQTWGLVLLVVLFVSVLIYVFWPKNRSKFRQASMVPLAPDDGLVPDRSDDGAADTTAANSEKNDRDSDER